MRALIQRVNWARVVVSDSPIGAIEKGILVLVGFEGTDTQEDVIWMAGKIVRLRIFDDLEGVMNLSVTDINADALVVSQFTLHAKTKKGNRPSYIQAAVPQVAIPLYNSFVQALEGKLGKQVPTGIFGAKMEVSLENDGPVTIFIDTKNKE